MIDYGYELQQLRKLNAEWKSALERVEREKAAILDGVSESILYVDTDMKIIYANKVVGELVGMLPEQMVGIYCYELFHGRDEVCSNCNILKVIESNQPQIAEKIYLDGRLRPSRAYPVQNEAGNLLGVFEIGINVNECRQTEQALQESRERYRLTVETANEGIWQVDEENRTTFVNRKMAEMLGYTIDEMMGQTPYAFMDEEWSKVAEANMWRPRQGIRGQFEYKYQRKDGTDLWAIVSAAPVFRDDGSYAGAIGMHVDITERKQAEDALRESEEKYRTIFENTGTAAMIVEEDTTMSLINREFETLSGYSKEEIEGKKSWKEFFIEDYLDDMIRYHNLRRADPDSAPKKYETEFITRKGDVKHIIDTVSMIPGTNQSIAFLLDISGIKQAEAELRFSEERFSKAFNACPGPMSISTFPDGRYIDVNEDFLQVLGYRREDVIGFTRSELNIWEKPEDLERATQILHEKKSFRDFVASIRTKSGELRIGLISGDIIDISGGEYMLLVFDDITERKLAEEALKQSEEKYRSLVVNLNDVIYTVNAEGYITYISPVIERFADYKAVESIGKPFMSYIHPEDLQGLLEHFRRSLSGQIERAEFRLLRKDGTYICVRSFSRVLAENGQVSLTGVLSDITERKRSEERLRESFTKLAKTFEQTVKSLSSIAEMRDPYTAGHQVRVAKLACEIASEIGMSEEQVNAIRTAALIHDIGKIIVPSEILNKPGTLSVLERSFVEAHAQASYEILKTIEFEFPIAEIILQHHEKLDGSGYPQGLSGDSILKEARVLTVADVIEAMASYRPYRPALPLKTALEEISSHRGTLYDADVVDACLRLFLEKGFSLS
jgi:PAS domain S-box-containing protein/putative nucleotidyltransferase with HDIG domain